MSSHGGARASILFVPKSSSDPHASTHTHSHTHAHSRTHSSSGNDRHERDSTHEDAVDNSRGDRDDRERRHRRGDDDDRGEHRRHKHADTHTRAHSRTDTDVETHRHTHDRRERHGHSDDRHGRSHASSSSRKHSRSGRSRDDAPGRRRRTRSQEEQDEQNADSASEDEEEGFRDGRRKRARPHAHGERARSRSSSMSGSEDDARGRRRHGREEEEREDARDAAGRRERNMRPEDKAWINPALERRLQARGGSRPDPHAREEEAPTHAGHDTRAGAEAVVPERSRMGWMTAVDGADAASYTSEPAAEAAAAPQRSLLRPASHVQVQTQLNATAAALGAESGLDTPSSIVASTATAESSAGGGAAWRERMRARMSTQLRPHAQAATPTAEGGDEITGDAAAGATTETARAAGSAADRGKVGAGWRRERAAVAAEENAGDSAPGGPARTRAADAGALVSAPPTGAPMPAAEVPRSVATSRPSHAVEPPIRAPPPSTGAPPPDLNRLHAAAMRAQLVGDTAKYETLMQRIRAAESEHAKLTLGTEAELSRESLAANRRPAALSSRGWADVEHRAASIGVTGNETADVHARRLPVVGGGNAQGQADEHVEVVTAFDERGMPLASLASGKPAPLERDDLRSGSRAGKHAGRVNKHVGAAEPGEREAVFRGDMRTTTVADLIREERATGAGDLDTTMARNIAQNSRFRADAIFGASRSGVDEGDEMNVDDLAAVAESKDARLTARARQDRDMKRAVTAHNRMNNILASCWLCLDSADIKRHLIISLGEYSMLMVPPDGQRVPGHMIIVPIPHVVAMTDADEEVYNEVNRFKSALHRMYAARDEDALFLETAIKHGRKRHTRVDVVPMDKEVAFDAPLYYRKAITEAEEWTANKALIDTTGKGLRRSVPKGFPYFHVSWQGGGFVHVVEDEEAFPESFGMDIAAGMLGLPPGTFDRRAQRRTFEQERELVLSFLKDWDSYDWTRTLEGGQ